MSDQSITLPRSVVEQTLSDLTRLPAWASVDRCMRAIDVVESMLSEALKSADAIDTSAERVHKSAESEHDATAKAIVVALADALSAAIAQLEALGVK